MSSFLISPLPGVTGTGECLALKRLETRKGLEEEFIKAEVLRLGLMPRGDESPLITNHRLIPLMCIVDMIQFGFASFEPEFARNVRKGKSDRMTWIHMFEMFEYSAKTSSMLSSAIDEVLDRLKLTREDVGLKGKK